MEEILKLIQEFSPEIHFTLNNTKLLAQTRADENGVYWEIYKYGGILYKVKFNLHYIKNNSYLHN